MTMYRPAKFSHPIIELKPGQLSSSGKSILPEVMNGKNGFLLVYSPACPPCNAMAPEFQKFANKANDRIRVLAINSKKYPKVFDIMSIQGTPSMFFVDRNGRIGKEHLSERTASSFLKFICSQISNDVSGFCLM